jgi:alpha(1,3/1,4) fucosyltransferase
MVLKIAYYNFWKDSINDNYFTRFLEFRFKEKIQVVSAFKCKDLDILISSCMGNIKFIKIIKARCKIFYYGENLNRYPPYNDEKILQDTFDLIVGFKPTNLLEKTIRFPLWLIYYPYYSYLDNDNILSYIQNQYDIKKINKNKYACLIARHDFGGQRKIITDVLSKWGNVDCPGLFNNNCSPIGPNPDDKLIFLTDYQYNICPENSKYPGYHTEKIFQALEAGCIPLYWGIDKPEKDIINENKYCFCPIENSVELSINILSCIDNKNIFLSGPVFKKGAGDIIKGYYDTLFTEISKKIN